IQGDIHANLRALLEARRAVEAAVTRLVAERARETDLERLRALVEELAAAREDPLEFLRVDTTFHYALADVCRSAVLARHLRGVLDQLQTAAAPFPFGRVVDQELALANQRATLAAIESRDPVRVAAAVDDHLGALEEAFLGERLR